VYTLSATRIRVERTLTSNGLEVMVRIYQDGQPDIMIFCNAENIARLARSMGIHTIEIAAHTALPAELADNSYVRAGFPVTRADSLIGFTQYQTAVEFAAEIITTLMADSAGKRGRKFIPHIRIWDSYNDKVVRESGRQIDGLNLLD
jgi:hypothetical protein